MVLNLVGLTVKNAGISVARDGGKKKTVGTNPAIGMGRNGGSDPNQYSKGTELGQVLISTQVQQE